MLALLCTLAMMQGLPPKLDPPPPGPDSRMILTTPRWAWREYWNFLSIPKQERRAAFEKLPVERRRLIMDEHLDPIIRHSRPKLSEKELAGLEGLRRAAVVPSLTDREAREKLHRAEENASKVLRKEIVKEIQALLPPKAATTVDSKLVP